jgi:hypothetical protein
MRILGTPLIYLFIVVTACDRIPGTQAYQISHAKKDVAEQLIDPTSPLFRNVRLNKTGTSVCGEYNGKNRQGAYTGFSKFVVPQGSFVGAQLDPEYDETYLKTLDDMCSASRQASTYARQARAYGISVPTLSSDQGCSEADEYRSKRAEQVNFSKRWWRECYYDGTPPPTEKWLQE